MDDILKIMEEENEIKDDTTTEIIRFNFSKDDINNAINNILDELKPKFNTVFDVSMFLGNVAKKLISTLVDSNLKIKDKYRVIFEINKTVIDELEERGIITMDLAFQFREMFKDDSEVKDIVYSVSDFFDSSPEERTRMISSAISGFIGKFLTN